VVTDEGRRLRVAEDEAGTELWPTEAEEQARRRKEAEQRAEAAEWELAELRQELARRQG
jgi:hypothetical protein